MHRIKNQPVACYALNYLHKTGGFETVEAAVHNAITPCPNAVRTEDGADKLIKAPITVWLYCWALGAAPERIASIWDRNENSLP